MSRAAGRQGLAAHAAEALPDGAPPDFARVLACADRLVPMGQTVESHKASTAVYEATVKVFEDTQG